MRLFIKIALLAAFVLAGTWLQDRAGANASIRHPKSAANAFVPRATVVRFLALGQSTAASDLYWLRFVSYLGNELVTRERAPHLLPLARLITDLDPSFAYAHEAAGLALNEFKRFDEAQRILDLGVSRNPHRWQTPFYAGFNAWSGLQQYEKGAQLFLSATRVPGAPRYLADLAARLFATSDALTQGIALLDAMLADPGLDSAIRAELDSRRRDLVLEAYLREVDERLDTFRLRNGRAPFSLEECGVGPGGPVSVPEGLVLRLNALGILEVEGFERLQLYEPGK